MPNSRDSNYEIGYGKAPRASQFKPGESSNPRELPLGQLPAVERPTHKLGIGDLVFSARQVLLGLRFRWHRPARPVDVILGSDLAARDPRAIFLPAPCGERTHVSRDFFGRRRVKVSSCGLRFMPSRSGVISQMRINFSAGD